MGLHNCGHSRSVAWKIPEPRPTLRRPRWGKDRCQLPQVQQKPRIASRTGENHESEMNLMLRSLIWYYSKLTVHDVGKSVHKLCNVWRDDVVFFAPALCGFVSYVQCLESRERKGEVWVPRMVTSLLQWVVPRSRGMNFRGKAITLLSLLYGLWYGSGPIQDREHWGCRVMGDVWCYPWSQEMIIPQRIIAWRMKPV